MFEFDEYFRFMCNQYILMEVLREHYERLGTAAVDEQFDDSLEKYKVLNRGFCKAEITKCSKSLKNNKTGGNNGLVGEIFKYGGKGMANLLKVLYGVVWTEESIPKQWRQGLIVRL